MQYLIDRATIVEEEKQVVASLLIEDKEIRSIGNQFQYYQTMRMDVGSFYLTPSSVLYSGIPDMPFQSFKSFFSERFLLRGCSLLITSFSIQYEYQFDNRLNEKRTRLLNSPIDYLLGVEIAPHLLTPTLIRKCKIAKIPIIFIRFTKPSDLLSMTFNWVREAAFPYHPVCIPLPPPFAKTAAKKRWLQKWTRFLRAAKLQHLESELTEDKPLSITELKKIGIYPKKGILRSGGEISYNLYLKKGESFDHVSKQPEVSICKGEFTSIRGTPIFRPGFGQEMVIEKTALFI